MISLPLGIAVLIAASLFYSKARQSDVQWLGMEIAPLVPQTSTALGLPADQQGVFVSDVVGVAADAGVMEGDVIVAVNGQPTADLQDLQTAIHAVQGHASLRLDLIRQGAVTAVVIGQSSPGGAIPAALPPACATCPSVANCLPRGGATPAALPPACATCPSVANCLPGTGATPAALPPWATAAPFVPAAFMGGGTGCPLR